MLPAYIKANVVPVPDSLRVSPFYTKYADAIGIRSSPRRRCRTTPLLVARDIVNTMLAARPDLRKALIARKWRTGVIAEVEMTMDIPEYAQDEAAGGPAREPVTQTDRDYHANRSRGLGGNPTTGAEENLSDTQAPAMGGAHLRARVRARHHGGGIRDVDPAMNAEIRAAYDSAMAAAKYVHLDGRKHYATTKAGEYWAEGVQWWFFRTTASASPATCGWRRRRSSRATTPSCSNCRPGLHYAPNPHGRLPWEAHPPREMLVGRSPAQRRG